MHLGELRSLAAEIAAISNTAFWDQSGNALKMAAFFKYRTNRVFFVFLHKRNCFLDAQRD